MSNLSELLPAGAGAKEFEAVASGTLSNGQTVILNSDGTVEAVAETAISVVLGTSVAIGTDVESFTQLAYDSTNNKVIVAFADRSNSNYGTAVVGTVSGTSISFGTAVVFESASTEYVAPTFDAANGKVVIAYRDGGANAGVCVVGTVSGTSISFGTPVEFEGGNTLYVSSTYDSANEKVVFAFRDAGDSNAGKCRVGTVSGTSISFGSEQTFDTDTVSSIGISYDSASEKVVIVYRDSGNSNYGTAIVGTVSGTSITYGSPIVIDSVNAGYTTAVYDSTNNKTVVTYKIVVSPAGVYAKVGTVSGTSISFGSRATLTTNGSEYVNSTYDNTAKAVVTSYWDTTLGQGSIQIGTVSGTSITYASAIQLISGQSAWNSLVYDANAGKTVIAYADSGDAGLAAVLQAGGTSTNAADFIGITAEAISDTATGVVTPKGGVNNSVSSLTTGSDYYVQDDGTISTTVSSVPAGRALSTTSILLEG
jgi:hypothetical protein